MGAAIPAIAAAAPYLTAASAAFSIFGGMQQGNQGVADAKFQKQQMESAAADELLASTQEEAQRRKELNDTLSTIDAMRAASGLSLRSPTGRNIQRTNIENATRDIGIAKTNRMVRADQYKREGAYGVSAARSKRTSAIIGGVGNGISLLKGI